MVGLGVETAPGKRFQTAYQDATCAEGRDAGFASPANWGFDMLVLPRADAIEAAYTALAAEACGMDREEARHAEDDSARDACWETYFDRSIDAVIPVSRELTRRTRAQTGVFAGLPVVDVVCDPSQRERGEEWLRRCVDEPLLSTLFPDLS